MQHLILICFGPSGPEAAQGTLTSLHQKEFGARFRFKIFVGPSSPQVTQGYPALTSQRKMVHHFVLKCFWAPVVQKQLRAIQPSLHPNFPGAVSRFNICLAPVVLKLLRALKQQGLQLKYWFEKKNSDASMDGKVLQTSTSGSSQLKLEVEVCRVFLSTFSFANIFRCKISIENFQNLKSAGFSWPSLLSKILFNSKFQLGTSRS